MIEENNKSTKIFIFVYLFLSILAAILAFSLVFFHTGNNKNAQAKQPTLIVEKEIQIGVILPMSGSLSNWGRTIKDGIDLALEKTQKPFKIHLQDSGCDPQKAKLAAKQLLEQEHVKIIIGPACVTEVAAIADIVNQQHAIMFSTGLLDNSVFGLTSNIINLSTEISTEVDFILKHLTLNEKSHIAVVSSANYFGKEYTRSIKELAPKYGIDVVLVDETPIDAIDFSSEIKDIRGKKIDALFIQQSEVGTIEFLKQLKKSPYHFDIYTSSGIENQSMLEGYQDLLEGVLFTAPYNVNEGSEEKIALEKSYNRLTDAKRVPSATTFAVYDGILLLDSALKKCSEMDVPCIKQEFVNLGKHAGMSGEMLFHPDGSNTRPFGIKQIHNGFFEWKVQDITNQNITP